MRKRPVRRAVRLALLCLVFATASGCVSMLGVLYDCCRVGCRPRPDTVETEEGPPPPRRESSPGHPGGPAPAYGS